MQRRASVGTGVTRRLNHSAQGTSGVPRRSRADRGQLPKLVIAGEAQVPVAVKDTVVAAATEFQSVASHHPSQIVLQRPTVLNEPNNLASFEGAKGIAKATFRFIVNDNVGSRLFGRVAFGRRVEEPVVGEVHFVRNARVECMRFNERQIVTIQ